MKELLQRAIQINEELGAKLKELKDLEEPNLLGADGKYFDKESMSIKDIEKEPVKPTFKEGDWVLITKPRDVTQIPIWPYWHKYDGKTLMIERIDSDNYLVIDGWKFNSDCCKKVEAPKVGDLCIFWDNKKTDAVIGKLTEINNKSDFPYEVADVVNYKNCIPFQSIEQYNEFIEE